MINMVISIKKAVGTALVLGALALAILGGTGNRAGAHAIIVETTPPSGASVAGPEVEFKLRFNSRLDQQRSRLSLRGADGKATPLPIILPAAEPTTIKTRARGLVPGAYLLQWQVLAVDGHMTRGKIPYTVTPTER